MLHHDRWNQGTKKQIHFGISLEFTLVAKWKARFIKKSQSVKKWYTILSIQELKTKTNVRSDRESPHPSDPNPLILHCRDNCSWRHDGQAHPPRDFCRSDWRVHHLLNSAIMLQLGPRHWAKGREHLIQSWSPTLPRSARKLLRMGRSLLMIFLPIFWEQMRLDNGKRLRGFHEKHLNGIFSKKSKHYKIDQFNSKN